MQCCFFISAFIQQIYLNAGLKGVCVCYTLRMKTVCAFFASKNTLTSIKPSQTITYSMVIVNDTNVVSNDSILTTEFSRVLFSDCKILSFTMVPRVEFLILEPDSNITEIWVKFRCLFLYLFLLFSFGSAQRWNNTN